jgi:flagellar basal-body rod protein FlgC
VNAAAAITQSALVAATVRLDVSASNLANAQDAAPIGAAPAYAPKQVIQTTVAGGGALAKAVSLRPGQLIAYDPASPVASAQGLTQTPDIQPVTEVTNQLAASRAFAFALQAWRTAMDEQQTALNMTA